MELAVNLKSDALALDIEQEIKAVKHLKSEDIEKELLKTNSQKQLREFVAKFGGQVYKDVNAFRRAPLFSPISIVSSSGKAVEAIRFVIVETYNEALRYKDTGLHSNSFWTYQGTIGGREELVRSAAQLKVMDNGVYTAINSAAYAATLEKMFLPDGIMYLVYRKTKRKFGAHISIRYDYTSASNYMADAKGGTLPRIQIAAPGRLREGAVKPGSARSRRRSYASVKGRSR